MQLFIYPGKKDCDYLNSGFMWSIWKKRRRSRDYLSNDKLGRLLFIAFHNIAWLQLARFTCSTLCLCEEYPSSLDTLSVQLLHGIYEAIKPGQMNINKHGWSSDSAGQNQSPNTTPTLI